MIYREHYIEKIREFYDSDLIKIITGIRRCGKSIILEQIMEEIKKKTDNVIYLNFEDKRTASKISNSELINSFCSKTAGIVPTRATARTLPNKSLIPLL